MEEKDRLIFCIQRFDHYYDSINNKGALYLALGTFILGGQIASIDPLHEYLVENCWLLCIGLLSLALSLITLIQALRATKPYLSNDLTSNFYFGSIAKSNVNAFCENSANIDSQDLEDLRLQTHSLASGLQKKFILMRSISSLFILQLLCVSVIGISILLITL